MGSFLLLIRLKVWHYTLKKGDLFWEYKKSGAAHAAMVSLDRDYLGGQLRDIMKRESKFTKLIKNPIEALRAMSEATEMATRLAEYDNARKGYTGLGNRLFGKDRKPLSAREAALESRDITLDFSPSRYTLPRNSTKQ